MRPSPPESERSPDPLDIYIHESCDHDLLSPDQERDLARRIRDGDKEASDTLVTSNLRLAVFWARRYKASFPSADLQDLIQEANLGLIDAVNGFDPSFGRFSTYAAFHIKKRLLNHMKEDHLVHVPSHVQETIRKARKLQERGHTFEESLAALKISEKMREAITALSRTAFLPLSPRSQEEFDVPMPEEEPEHDDPRLPLLAPALAALPARERAILERYHGLRGEAATYRHIAEELGVSNQRICQLMKNAKRKLHKRMTTAVGER